jgi:GTP pyrophosphokinase
MVKVKEHSAFSSHESWTTETWLKHLQEKGYDTNLELAKYGFSLTQLYGQDFAVETGETCFRHGLSMAELLTDLGMDLSTVVAALIFSSVQYAELSLDVVAEQLGGDIARLVGGVLRMNVLSAPTGSSKLTQKKSQMDNWRKMLLAMVDDVRVVLIKLADRLCVLRATGHMPEPTRWQLANEAMNIYAPLAHRLGIGAIKWEIEDLAFRYLHPDDYKTIAKGLRSKRLERDRYVNWIVEQLQLHIKNIGLKHFSIYGRSKHIHSIFNKMRRKKVPLDEIYDATAVRILVDTKEECYDVLGLVHSLWTPVPKEFDDYIVQPKSNGYQSLHTAVIGPESRIFEVQIRTFDMHNQAEIGIAAHWKYKEGSESSEQSYERKIAWLRQVLSWHREMAGYTDVSFIEAPALDDRVYVFTPNYDVIDLPKGSTVLDFAYDLHTDVGHRTRGAKVNGAIVQLNQVLKTADRVEILMAKESKPSRDWLSKQSNYLMTSKAKAKVLHWFKKQDFDVYRQQGHIHLEKELRAQHIKFERLNEVLDDLGCHDVDDLYAAIGRGDIKLSQVVSRLVPQAPAQPKINRQTIHASQDVSKQLVIEGVGHLLTHFAKCCHPVLGEPVVGYMTVGRGVSIHRQNCSHIKEASDEQKQRFLSVSWIGEYAEGSAKSILRLQIEAHDRPDLLRELTSYLTKDFIRILSLQTRVAGKKSINHIMVTIEISNLQKFIQIQKEIELLAGLIKIKHMTF